MSELNNGKMTGFASIDKPWLKYYESNADEMAKEVAKNKTTIMTKKKGITDYEHH